MCYLNYPQWLHKVATHSYYFTTPIPVLKFANKGLFFLGNPGLAALSCWRHLFIHKNQSNSYELQKYVCHARSGMQELFPGMPDLSCKS